MTFNGDGSGEDEGFGICIDDTAQFICIAGVSKNPGTDNDDIFVLKIRESDQTSIWKRTVDGTNTVALDVAHAIAMGSDGAVVVAGAVDRELTNKDIWAGKNDSSGGTILTQTIEGDGGLSDTANQEKNIWVRKLS